MGIFYKDLIVLNFSVKDKKDFLLAASDYLYELGYIEDVLLFFKMIVQREQEYSTAIGKNIAIPHCLNGSVKKNFVAYFRLEDEIKWPSEVVDDDNVKHVFVIGVKDGNKDNIHLKILAKLSRNILHEEFEKKVLYEKDSNKIFTFLENVED